MSSIKTIVTLALITALSIVSIGCSDSTDPVAIDPPVVIDTAPPAVPANFELAYDGGVVTLSWEENTTDADFDGYILSRDNNGDITDLVSTRGFFLSYTDTPAMGLNIYQIYAVDLVGNQSAVASVSYQRSGEHHDDIDIQF